VPWCPSKFDIAFGQRANVDEITPERTARKPWKTDRLGISALAGG